MSGNVSSSTLAGEVSVAVTAATPEGNSVNFDDLAISFITETLQTVQPPPSDPDPTPAGNLRLLQSKLLLAARQKRLEQHIAETKVLMAKLGTAKSKAEKDKVLSMLRERQR
ncbi:hypothetical protein DAEQUDRAFT_670072 [Daedalea quercina L-15889]|uniref:Uncharacterized protein n=1 Tax=Daedalea quercina L-15889 TaxID=1314783 RepID=A0A165QAA6_9APHY|nr:hypothetical protein DAEQUDRAFT_670072 [Daedalea quercina L-15889]